MTTWTWTWTWTWGAPHSVSFGFPQGAWQSATRDSNPGKKKKGQFNFRSLESTAGIGPDLRESLCGCHRTAERRGSAFAGLFDRCTDRLLGSFPTSPSSWDPRLRRI
ncbi:hypothetical protein NL676_034916 [Syzygium grande]|nr:hypothetical protein NL676_034916 [Syzygium grande]